MTRPTQALAALSIVLAACGSDATPMDGGATSTDATPDVTVDGGATSTDAAADATTDGASERAPTLRNSVSLSDAELARQALRLMGAPQAGGSGSCNDCHGLTRASIAHFATISDTAWSRCFSDLSVETEAAAQSIVGCFRDAAAGTYHTGNLGVFATGATFEWFRFVFRRALGAEYETEYARFLGRVQQPPAPRPAFTQEEFDLLTEWFLRGTPEVDSILPPDDGPGTCTSYVSDSVAGIVADGRATGWSARNAEDAILMHGCAGASNPVECLASYPRVSTTRDGALWEVPGTQHRVLYEIPYSTVYWTRSSADGRFVAHGNGTTGRASIIDLQRGFAIPTDAAYDPGFFPDNSGFVFQGTPSGTGLCAQTVLSRGEPTRITFGEAGCSSSSGVDLYQHVGASLDGGDYWMVNSVWVGDPGGGLQDPAVFADASSTVTLFRFTNTASGTAFTPGGSATTPTPWQANAVISPSMRLLVTQLAGATGEPIGYVLHRIDMTRDTSGSVTSVSLPEVARYCVPGGKAAFSLDDRWLVTHHRATDADAVDLGFSSASDPGFAAFRGVSNVYLIDLLTGREIRVTNIQPGQEALFPHFRSDGWLYYIVRTGAAPEYLVATDAAIVMR